MSEGNTVRGRPSQGQPYILLYIVGLEKGTALKIFPWRLQRHCSGEADVLDVPGARPLPPSPGVALPPKPKSAVLAIPATACSSMNTWIGQPQAVNSACD